MKKNLTEEEQENVRASELMDKKTSEIIDAIHIEEDDKVLGSLFEEMDKRYPETTITQFREEFETFQNNTQKKLDKIEDRLSRIDNHYLIANKLDNILSVLKKK